MWQIFLRVSPVSAMIALVVFCRSAIAQENAAGVKVEYHQTDELSTEKSKKDRGGQNPEFNPLEPIEPYHDDLDDLEPDNALEQVTNVSQLRDVQPGDWAYQALRSLIERYGIFAGYANGLFQGNRALTRYEFAAALRQTLDQIQLLLSRRKNSVPPPDLAVLERLTDEFVLELSLLRGDVDALTARTAELELTQFSTTTKLNGEEIIGIVGRVGGDDKNSKDTEGTTILGHRTRLNLDTSFTGDDLLRTRLQAEGLGLLEEQTLTPEGELAFTGAKESDLQIDALLYRFPVGSRTQVVVAANGGDADDFTYTLNPYLDGDGAKGALSRFATRPPLYNLVQGAGIGVRHQISDTLEVSVGYLAGEAGNPQPNRGLFGGSYGALAQVVYQPSDRASLGFTYVNAYNQDLQTGSDSANVFDQLGLPVVTNSYGIAASIQLNPQLVVGGWVGYTAARVIGEGDAKIWNWAVTLGFPDLLKTGNLAGFIIGMEPKVTATDHRLSELGIEDASTSLHLEAFYQYQLTPNITITPGIIWLTAPNHDNHNEDQVIGTIRTTFEF